MTDLLPGWESTTLGDIVEVLDHLRVPVSAQVRASRIGEIPYYGATGQVGWINDHLFDENLVLLGEDGIGFLDPVKPKAYEISGPSWVNNHAHILRLHAGVEPAFLVHLLNQLDYRDYVTGTTRLKLTKSSMLRLPIKLPPSIEQTRIVAVTKQLLSSIELGAAHSSSSLRKIDQLKRSTLEELLGDGATLQPMKQLDEVVTFAGGATPRNFAEAPTSKNGSDSIPFYKVGDMNDSDGRYMAASRSWYEPGVLRSTGVQVRPEGTVLVPKRGGAIATNKKRILARPSGFDVNIMGLIPSADLSSSYLWYWLQTVNLAEIADGSNVPQINAPHLKPLRLPIPSFDRQAAVVETLDRTFSKIDRVRETLERVAVDRLRYQVISAALSGRLGTQDEHDAFAAHSA